MPYEAVVVFTSTLCAALVQRLLDLWFSSVGCQRGPAGDTGSTTGGYTGGTRTGQSSAVTQVGLFDLTRGQITR